MQLRQFLSEEKISTREFAEIIEVTPEAVRLYLGRQRTPRPEVLRRIERVTQGKVTANDFISVGAA